jgi:subfamily B ATP-binding cassette protein MsbA
VNKSTTRKLLSAARPHQGLFYLALGAMLISGLASVLPSWLVKISIDGLSAVEHKINNFNILPQQAMDFLAGKIDLSVFEIPTAKLLLILPLSIVVIAIIEAFFKFLYQYYTRELGLLVVKDLKEKYHSHINLLSLARQRQYDSGSLVSVISSDLQSMQSWLAESLMNMFTEIFKAVFLFAWLLILDWKLTVYAVIAIPLFALPVVKLGKSIRSYAKQGQDYVGTISSFLAESLRNQAIIKAFNLEKWREEKFKQESQKLYKLFHKWILRMALVSPLTNIIGAFGIAAILFFGISAVNNAELTIGEFSSFFVTSILLYDPIKRLGRVTTIVQSALGVADRVFEILDQQTQIQENPNQATQAINGFLSGEIVFENLVFGYEGKTLFKDFNLHIPAKTSLALVGPSGGGKSSLVSLIPRFYETDSGKISIDGINTKNMSLSDLRRQIAIVTQEPLLFVGTIRENIALGLSKTQSPTEIDELVNKAAKDSYVMNFAQALENGLDSQVGEGGNKLSVGQKQRISIARALISGAPIIILDEPTSALDNESQEYIYRSIQKLMQDRTVIIIAHRLSTIKACDRIVYLEDGKIIEAGSHQDLVNKGTAYSELLG